MNANLIILISNLAVILISLLATLACVGVIAFVALVLSVARAQEKIDDQNDLLGLYRAERKELISSYRENLR